MAEPARLLQMPSASSGRSLPGLSLVKAPPDSQIGTPIRVVLVVVVLGALLFAVKTFVLGGGGESVPLDAASLSVVHVPKTPPTAPAATPAKATPAKETPAAAAGATGAHGVKPSTDLGAAVAQAEQTAAAATARVTAPNATAAAVDPVAAAAAAAAAAATPAAGPVVDSHLPKPIVSALRRNAVVVVGLYSPDSSVAELAWREALSGAQSSGAGFVAVDVHKEALAGPLTALLGVMSDPTLIVFMRPGKVFVRLDGYIDRETVAQAVANAKLAQ